MYSCLRNTSLRTPDTTQPGNSATKQLLMRHLWNKQSTTSKTCLRVQKQIAPSFKYNSETSYIEMLLYLPHACLLLP
jgi:hypothetical protein